MKKVFLLIAVIILLFSGCAKDKDTSSNDQVTATAESIVPPATAEESQLVPYVSEAAEGPSEQPAESSSDQAQQGIDELKGVLDGISGSDFSDADYTE